MSSCSFITPGKFRYVQRTYLQPELLNSIISCAVIVVWSCWCRLRLRPESVSADETRSCTGAFSSAVTHQSSPAVVQRVRHVVFRHCFTLRPHRLVCVHTNQTHLFVNTAVSHAAVSQKKSSNVLCYRWQPSPTVTEPHITTLNIYALKVQSLKV